MILGIGTDIVNCNRIEKIFSSNSKIERIFSDKEIDICKGNIQSLSGRFAAKEALIKAVKIPMNINFKEIEIEQDEFGSPIISNLLVDRIGKILNKKVQGYVSISHENEFAIAFVVLESKDEK